MEGEVADVLDVLLAQISPEVLRSLDLAAVPVRLFPLNETEQMPEKARLKALLAPVQILPVLTVVAVQSRVLSKLLPQEIERQHRSLPST